MFAKFIFIYCALLILGSGVAAVQLRNPVHSVLSVLVLFFHMAILYLLLNAEFLAAIQIIVYGGGVLVLYLFVIFLVSLRTEIKINRFVTNQLPAAVLAFLLCVILLAVLPAFQLGTKGNYTADHLSELTHTRAMGLEMFSNHLLSFEIAGVILLVAVIGGLVLARREKKSDQPEEPLTPSSHCEVEK
ncbi:MAG: NADH-quinone oxidoreductase subunit J [Thermodesulfobacteriota bacterium]